MTGWVKEVPTSLKTQTPLALLMWFVVHEFSMGDSQVVVQFFHELRSVLPDSELILGEITALPVELLAEHHETSIMPELLLFHELSQQGVLSWKAWQKILIEIPYTLGGEHLFDLREVANGSAIPSSFVWHLKPK